MRQRPICYTNHKLKKFPLSQEASCLGSQAACWVPAPGETEIQGLTPEREAL